MKPKLFVFCRECGSFEHEIKIKSDLYKFCPLCGKKLKGAKIPGKKYLECIEEIKGLGVGMWFGIETMFVE